MRRSDLIDSTGHIRSEALEGIAPRVEWVPEGIGESTRSEGTGPLFLDRHSEALDDYFYWLFHRRECDRIQEREHSSRVKKQHYARRRAEHGT